MVVDGPRFRPVVRDISSQHDADQGFVLADIKFVVQLAGKIANTLEHGHADGFDIAGGVGVFGPSGTVEGGADDAGEFAVEADGLVLGVRLHPLDRAHHHARAKRGERHHNRRPRTGLALLANRRHDDCILGGANHNAALGQIHGDFLRWFVLCGGRGREKPQMHTDEHG